MNYESENWIKVYTRDSAGWLSLSWQARGIALELSRKLSKDTGEISVGRHGLRGIAVLLRADWSEIEPFILELITDGRLVYDEARQVVGDPGHPARQNAVTTDAERSRRYRERMQTIRDVTERDDASLTVTDRHAPSRDVTKERKKEREKERERERESVRGNPHDDDTEVTQTRLRVQAPSPEPISVPSPAKPRKPKLEGSPIPEDWKVSPALMAWAKGKGVSEYDVTDTAERFLRHWLTSTKDNAIKRNWDRAFQAWLDGDIERGKVMAAPLAPPAPMLPELTPEQEDRRRRGREMVAAALAQMDAQKAVGS